MNRKLIASMAGTICCAGLALIPVPWKQWAKLRTAAGVGAVGCSIAGYCISQSQKEQQLAIDKWQFQQEQAQRAIEAATRPIVIETAVKKIATQAEYALADHRDDMSALYTLVDGWQIW
jgi:hypothetical protein